MTRLRRLAGLSSPPIPVLAVALRGGLSRAEPVAGDWVEPEAVRLPGGSPGRPEVRAPDQGRVAVGEARDRLAVGVLCGRVEPARPVAVVLEPVGGDDPEPGAAALLLIGGDPLPLPGEDRMQRQQPVLRRGELDVAHLATVVAWRDRVVIPAPRATVRVLGADLPGRVGWQLDAVDLVPGALVVDEGPRAELPDCQEPGPLHVVALAPHAPAAGDIGGDGQPRERVAGQEPLGGEVPVRVEVGADVHVVAALVAKQRDLGLGLGPAAASGDALRLAQLEVLLAPVLLPLVGERRAEQHAPPVEGAVERLGSGPDYLLEPAGIPPGGLRPQVVFQLGQDRLRPRGGAADRIRGLG